MLLEARACIYELCCGGVCVWRLACQQSVRGGVLLLIAAPGWRHRQLTLGLNLLTVDRLCESANHHLPTINNPHTSLTQHNTPHLTTHSPHTPKNNHNLI